MYIVQIDNIMHFIDTTRNLSSFSSDLGFFHSLIIHELFCCWSVSFVFPALRGACLLEKGR